MGLADVLIDAERFTEAEKVLKETIDLVPGTVQAHYRLGRLYQSLGKYPEALKELEYTARFTPLVGQDPLYEMVALIYASQADFARATEALRKQVAVNPNNADAHRRLGDGYVRQERTMEALAEFTAALLIDRRSVLSHVGISQIHFRSANYLQLHALPGPPWIWIRCKKRRATCSRCPWRVSARPMKRTASCRSFSVSNPKRRPTRSASSSWMDSSARSR